MPDVKRGGPPYVWVSWITGLLAGTDSCVWRPWRMARYKVQEVDEGEERKAFFEEWTAKHDAMVDNRERIVKGQGYLTRKEDAASFKLEGAGGTLSGKPDLVALAPTGAETIVYDQKSGKERQSDRWQVRLYLFALPRTVKWVRGALRGYVEYKNDKLVEVTLTAADADRIGEVMRAVTSSVEPPKTPSVAECKYCKIALCPSRETGGVGRTDSF